MMKINVGQWIEIFRAGDYGNKGNYSTIDLDNIVRNFQKEVPIVIGHPVSDSPACGWLCGVKRTGDKLVGKVGELHQDTARALAENKYRNVSVRIGQTYSGLKLLHLGLLGGILPQVEGLGPAASFSGFSGGGYYSDFDFRCGCDLAYKV